jgi:hypothetical protein
LVLNERPGWHGGTERGVSHKGGIPTSLVRGTRPARVRAVPKAGLANARVAPIAQHSHPPFGLSSYAAHEEQFIRSSSGGATVESARRSSIPGCSYDSLILLVLRPPGSLRAGLAALTVQRDPAAAHLGLSGHERARQLATLGISEEFCTSYVARRSISSRNRLGRIPLLFITNNSGSSVRSNCLTMVRRCGSIRATW